MKLADFIFPRFCLGCGSLGHYFCPECAGQIRPNRKIVCPECGQASLFGSTHYVCLKKFGLDGLTAIAHYDGLLKKAVKKLKYQFITDLAEELIEEMLGVIGLGKNNLLPDFDKSWILVPVPLYPQRERWRGFNQSALLGRIIAEKMGWGFIDDFLIRIKQTKPQAELKDANQRQANIKGAFQINPDSCLPTPNSKLIIFDDVWTTGSTINECARVLKKHQAAKVWALTLAR